MNNFEFADRLRALASEKTVYLWGTFGAPLSEGLIQQKAAQYPARYSAKRQEFLRKQIPARPWAFDCVGMIKGILWGWTGDESKSFGGAKYENNGVPDVGATAMANRTVEQSKDFDTITVGEAVFRSGHIGVYVGDGKVVEATLSDQHDGVVITDFSEGNWTGHGKLPWITYKAKPSPLPVPEEKKSPREGDTVYFSGNRHYTSANGTRSYTARPGPAKVTRYLPDKKHPYHLIHTDRTSNVYGWVDEKDV